MPTAARAPARLGKAGRSLWKQVTETYELRPDEVLLLTEACREADLIDRLHEEISTGEMTDLGSTGQVVVNPLISEIRQHRGVLATLLRTLKLPDGPAPAAGDRAAQVAEAARKAARAKWDRKRAG